MTPDVATQNQAVLELTGKIAINPALAQPLLEILAEVGEDVEKLRSLDLRVLTNTQDTLPKVEPSTEQELPTKNIIAGQEITLKDKSPAIEMQVSVNGQIIRAVLPYASFNTSRQDQLSYAQRLGGRLATSEENLAVASALLEKKEKGILNVAETNLLKTYCEKYVRDSQGGIGGGGHHIYDDDLYGDVYIYEGALVILPLAESK